MQLAVLLPKMFEEYDLGKGSSLAELNILITET